MFKKKSYLKIKFIKFVISNNYEMYFIQKKRRDGYFLVILQNLTHIFSIRKKKLF